MEKIPYFGQTLIRWRVGGSSFLALPEKGARLMNWSLEMGDGSVRDVVHWPDGIPQGARRQSDSLSVLRPLL
jgi:hypothetical protein